MDGMSFESVYIKMVFPYHFMGIVAYYCGRTLSSGNLYTFIRPNQEKKRKMKLRSLAGIEPAALGLNRALHRNRRAAGSIPARDLKLHFSLLLYKFPLDNFRHLQYPSNIIHSSEMPQKS
jgi:hypothetical protein